jgi:bile acid:Na+ symporter, BASS family
MAMVEIIPLWLVNVLSFTTVFSVMASIGTTITPSACFEHIRAPALLIRGLICVLVVVPMTGFAAGFAFELSTPEKVGIALMAIAPGAPLALRRALSSGGDAGFAPTLQIAVALLAVPAMPLWVFAGNWILGTSGIVDMAMVAKQIVLAQLLPLVLGAILKRVAPVSSLWIGTTLGRASAVLLIAAIISQLVDSHLLLLAARPWPVAAAVVTTVAAIAAGHVLGGGLPEVRHAVAIAGALRNVGLALLVAVVNRTPPTVEVVIINYAITAALVVTGYILLRHRVARPSPPHPSPPVQRPSGKLP